MPRAIAVVGARLNSSRLPGKHLLNLEGKTLIGRVFERLDLVPELSDIILATTADAYNQPLVDWAQTHGRNVHAFDGDVNDLMGRVNAVAQSQTWDVLVYVCGDSPLVEPTTISHMIRALYDNPAAETPGIRDHEGRKTIHEGFSIFACHYWTRLMQASTDAFHREHVGSAARDLEHIHMAWLSDDPVFFELDHRLSVDTPSDYRFMSEIYRRWRKERGADAIVDLPWVIRQLQQDPALAAINAAVHQRGARERPPRVLIMLAAGPGAGLGHLGRAMALATALQDHIAAGVRLLIAGPQLDAPELNLIPHLFVASDQLTDEWRAECEVFDPDILVVDWPADHDIDPWPEHFQTWRQRGKKLVSIDGAVSNHADLQWVPSFFLGAKHPTGVDAPPLRFGWDCFLLDGAATKTPARPQTPQVLILTGGGDVENLGESWPQLLDEALPTHIQKHWIQGPFAKQPQTSDQWHTHIAPSDLRPLMHQSHFALTGYGVSFFECLQHGVATVVYANPDRIDSAEIEALIKADCAIVVTNPTQAPNALANLIADKDHAARLIAHGQRLIDGHGPRRLAETIRDLAVKT